ncbi:unnamed protein product [Bursaphelenchus xylophilus]|uniref:(pine wood nematode) hypothetical protein n=1 Tax=Bursaphelenchus xylophilus TaxID=6326 RepID=A0A1I7RLL5_BURXY|nr:unnamed protein product [Bursaphelenchus xylophilus]CAG9082866.1 unnamed protein product [Bursaphelenchus xylophilus]
MSPLRETLLWLLFMQITQIHASPFLDVYLRVEPTDDFCGPRQCNISYAMSVLLSQNHFDLQSVMLQEGSMMRINDRIFQDNTVIRLSPDVLESDRIYLGLSLLDVPEDMQKYIVADVSDVISKGRKSRMEFTTETAKVTLVIYKRSEVSFHSEDRIEVENHNPWEITDQKQQKKLLEEGCHCEGKDCGCCRHLTVRKIHLDDDVCLNMTYIPQDLGVRVSMSVDGRVYYNKEISVTESLPICFAVPHLREYASLCIKMYNFEEHDKHVSFCTELEARLYHLKIARKKIGCMKVPI